MADYTERDLEEARTRLGPDTNDDTVYIVAESIATQRAESDARSLAEFSTTCIHCERTIIKDSDGRWVDPEATGDDIIWRETCDEHDTFVAEHEPKTVPTERTAP